MKKASWCVVLFLLFALTANLYAAPLFPDVPAEHWARDAVAELANKGLLEGYPDGTFKGDRAATRWEMAMVVARLLSKMEAEDAKFATKEDLENLKKLVDTLKEELDALGVRVTNLEDQLAKLDKRVWALEKITFYGDVDARVVSQGFINTGASNHFTRAAADANYNNLVGMAGGVNLISPFEYGFGAVANFRRPGINNSIFKMPVVDYFNGMPLTNGTGFTARATLGTKIRVSDDVSAGAEFSAFNSTGDPIVDAWWGVSAPYLSNVFASTMWTGFQTTANVQAQTNVPWTRMTLDNFWFTHNPSGSKLIIGAYRDNNVDDIVMFGTPNPNRISGPKVLPNYGFNLTGKTHLFSDLNYEVMMFMPPDSQLLTANGFEYKNGALAFDLDWLFERGNFKISYLLANNSFWAGNALTPGQQAAGVYNYFFWLRPQGYNEQQVGAINSPIVGLDNQWGAIGPQMINTWGAQFHYDLKNKWFFDANYGSSNYKPNMASGYSVNGAAYKFAIGTTLANDQLDLELGFYHTDPTYDPMVFSNDYLNATNVFHGFYRMPNWSFDPNLYQLHDSDTYTNNRQGIKFDLEYRFKSGDGKVWLNYGAMDQVQSSVPNVAYFSNSRAAWVYGFNPGWIEPFFSPLEMTAATSTALEDVKGKVTNWRLGVDYTFSSKLGVLVDYQNYKYQRLSGLGDQMPATASGTFGIAGNYNSNHIDMNMSELNLGLSYPCTDKFRLYAGWDTSTINGAYAGPGSNVNTTQTKPYLGFDYQISDNTCWDFTITSYTVADGQDIDNNDALYNANLTRGNLNWNGLQFSTGVKVTF